MTLGYITIEARTDIITAYVPTLNKRENDFRTRRRPTENSGLPTLTIAFIKKTIDVFGLEPHVYSRAQYHRMRSTIDKMIKGGVILFQT